KDRWGNSVLTMAVCHGNKEIASLLIQNGADLNIQEEEGKTALMIAIERNNFAIFQELIMNGADVLIKNNKGIDAYNLAMKERNQNMAQLIKEAAKKQLKAKKIISHQANNQAFLMAQKNGQGHIK
ncbi:MAG: ankyrin repeat domain-containing protein, partial [Alphaproteobacteria bacterium]|nr:ankyrin repeat domain-containing protein [Alphaproteobacteria bacterium]